MTSGLPTQFPSAACASIEDVFGPERLVPSNSSSSSSGGGGAAVDAAEAWVQRELDYYEDNYTDVRDLHVSVTTFNVASKRPSMPLGSLFALTHPTGAATDLVVLALQEVDMSARAMFMEETEAAMPWVQAANAAVGADASRVASSTQPYYALPARQLVGMLLCVYVRRALLPHLRDVDVMTVATGTMGGSVGNKGAVGLHLTLYRTSICVVCAHLASGQGNVSKRNEDIHNILHNMDFNTARRATLQQQQQQLQQQIQQQLTTVATTSGVYAPAAAQQQQQQQLQQQQQQAASMAQQQQQLVQLQQQLQLVQQRLRDMGELLPRDHDLVLVAGDLNYRVSLPYDRAVALAARGDVAELLRHDQLAAEMAAPLTPWDGFIAFTPTFLPTYRFDVGTTATYDTSEKRRVPSFTDRVCVYARRREARARVHLDAFAALGDVTMSDHKPVRAVLRVPVRVEVAAARARVTAQLRDRVATHGLDRATSAKTTLSDTAVDFATVQFHGCAHKRAVVTLTNVGECVAHVRVLRQSVPPPSSLATAASTTAKSSSSSGSNDDALFAVDGSAWVRVSPLDFAVLPGESRDVTIEVKVHPRCLPWLRAWRPYTNTAALSLTALLLLCVRHGPVHVVDCHAVLLPSVYGNSIENIARLGRLPCLEAYARDSDHSNNEDSDEATTTTRAAQGGDVTASPTSSLPAQQQQQQRGGGDKSAPSRGVAAAAGDGAVTVRPQLVKEVWLLADVVARSPGEANLFLTSTDADTCARIMAHLDSCSAALPRDTSVLCAGECLLLLLTNLQEPLVPYALYNSALAAGRARGAEAVALLRKLPTLNANVWIYLMALLNLVLQPAYTRTNHLSASLLAQVFAAALIVRPPSSSLSALHTTSSSGSSSSTGSIGSGGAARTLTATSSMYNDASLALQQQRPLEGVVSPQLRQQLQQERADAVALVDFFLTTPAALLQSY